MTHLRLVAGNNTRPDDDYEQHPPHTVHRLLDEILANLGADLTSYEVLDAGTCDDCGRHHNRRYQYGQVAICRDCGNSRIRVRDAA